MRATTKGAIEILGLAEMKRKLGPDLIQEPLAKAIKQATKAAETTLRGRVPVSSGRLKGSVTSTVGGVGTNVFGRVSAGAENNGFRYPFALEAGARRPARPKGVGKRSWRKKVKGTIVFHFRSGPNQGKPTGGWFSGTMKEAREKMGQILQAMAADIMGRWNR